LGALQRRLGQALGMQPLEIIIQFPPGDHI
jgi:hypothetical protein